MERDDGPSRVVAVLVMINVLSFRTDVEKGVNPASSGTGRK
jgi:hypothetical protein